MAQGGAPDLQSVLGALLNRPAMTRPDPPPPAPQSPGVAQNFFNNLAGLSYTMRGRPDPYREEFFSQLARHDKLTQVHNEERRRVEEGEINKNVQIAELMNRVQHQKIQEQNDRDRMIMPLAEKLAESNDPASAKIGQDYMKQVFGRQGVQIDPAAVINLKKAMTPDDRKAVITMLAAGMDDTEILGQIKTATPTVLQAFRANLENDEFRGIMGVPTRAKMQLEDMKAETESEELVTKTLGLDDAQGRQARRLAVATYGKQLSRLDKTELQDVLKKSSAVVPTMTAKQKNALAQYGPGVVSSMEAPTHADIAKVMTIQQQNENDIITRRAALTGQMNIAGALYKSRSDQHTKDLEALQAVDQVADEMERLIEEGNSLKLLGNPEWVNTMVQWAKYGTGGDNSPAAEWFKSYNKLPAQVMKLARGLEQNNNPRMAASIMQMALGMHPEKAEPYSVQKRKVAEIRLTTGKMRDITIQRIAETNRQFGAAADAAGRPNIFANGPLGAPAPVGHDIDEEWEYVGEKK